MEGDFQNVLTEADVEAKIILPLLTRAPCLEIPENSIRAKGYLPPAILDKNAGKTRGY
jgi:hypothetical protein